MLAISARNLNQLERVLNIARFLDEKANPARAREDMMNCGTPKSHQPIAICAPDKTIEQPVPMNMTQLFPAKKKTDSAKTMNSECYSGKPLRNLFDRADRAQAASMQQCRRKKQRRIK